LLCGLLIVCRILHLIRLSDFWGPPLQSWFSILNNFDQPETHELQEEIETTSKQLETLSMALQKIGEGEMIGRGKDLLLLEKEERTKKIIVK